MASVFCDICGCGDCREICDIKISPILAPSKLLQCKECGFFYANPRPEKAAEEDFYKRLHYKEYEQDFWHQGRMPVFKRLLGEIGKYYKSGRLLDVGCGMGYFMDLAKSSGWEVKGIDVSDYAADYARDKLGLEVRKGTLKDALLETEYFDVAVMYNVLDQLYEPRENLLELNRLLKKGGYLFLRLTNVYFHLRLFKLYNIIRRLFGNIESSPAIFHLYSFDKNSIKKLLESTGFSGVVVKTEPLDVNVPGLVRMFAKKESFFIALFNFCANAVSFISFGQIIISPSILVIAQK